MAATKGSGGMEPYWSDGQVSLYLGDCREVLPALDVKPDLIMADPPYGETDLDWDKWPDGWPAAAAGVGHSLWLFGSMRLLFARQADLASWRFSQDVIWSKPRSTVPLSDRFARSHETVTFWYRGDWRKVYHDPPRLTGAAPIHMGRPRPGDQWNHPGSTLGTRRSPDADPSERIMRSVLEVGNLTHGRPIHRTEKPTGLLDPLVRYGCPPGGLVLDLSAGSGSTLDAARSTGRRAIGIELHEPHAEAAAKRLDQMAFDFGEAS